MAREQQQTPLSLEMALRSSADGETLMIPAGVHVAPAGGWLITRSVTIMGEAATVPESSGVMLRRHAPGEPMFVVAPGVGSVCFTNLGFEGGVAEDVLAEDVLAGDSERPRPDGCNAP